MLAYATAANGGLHLLLVSAFSCTVLLYRCFLLNITACTAAHMGGRTFEREEHPLQQLHSKKGSGHIFESGLIFGRLWYTAYTAELTRGGCRGVLVGCLLSSSCRAGVMKGLSGLVGTRGRGLVEK